MWSGGIGEKGEMITGHCDVAGAFAISRSPVDGERGRKRGTGADNSMSARAWKRSRSPGDGDGDGQREREGGRGQDRYCAHSGSTGLGFRDSSRNERFAKE